VKSPPLPYWLPVVSTLGPLQQQKSLKTAQGLRDVGFVFDSRRFPPKTVPGQERRPLLLLGAKFLEFRGPLLQSFKMHKPSVTQLVYKHLYPRPNAQKDPPSFAQFVSRLLVQEVRTETTNFYGSLNCVEAQYPGLDYSFWAHRQRLSRFPYHKRLFKAFDELGLTKNEIYSICQWEGTKSAKDKYEKDAGRRIKDTTLEDVAVEPEREEPVAYFHGEDYEQPDMSEDDMDTVPNEITESYGVQLNEQLRAAADAQARGEPVVFDEQWEQWMKEALERNELGVDAIMDAIRDGRPFPTSPSVVLETTNEVFAADSPPNDSSSLAAIMPEPLINHSTASTSTQTTPRLSHTQEAMVNSLRRLESRMDDIVTPVTAATAEQLAAQAR
jgi:hypothetical protein